jgi:RNA polymerase sigma-70 factor (ECF subfamily)
MVRRLTRAVLHHSEDAEDAAQEAFFSAWTARERFDERQAFPPWLARIALNRARDLRRRRTVRSTESLEAVPAAGGGAPDEDAGDALLHSRLDRALTELSERQRVALLLFEVEGYAAAEIGELLGVPEGTVRSDVFHARRKLRAVLGELERF